MKYLASSRIFHFQILYLHKRTLAVISFFHAPKDGGTLPHLHHDAFNMLIYGEKRWILHDAGRQIVPRGKSRHAGLHAKLPPWCASQGLVRE